MLGRCRLRREKGHLALKAARLQGKADQVYRSGKRTKRIRFSERHRSRWCNVYYTKGKDVSRGEVAVVGAGAVGLFTAVELIRHGFEVTIYDDSNVRRYPNASWGNAGHIAPLLAGPLASFDNLAAAARGSFGKAPFMLPPREFSASIFRFIGKFAWHSRPAVSQRYRSQIVQLARAAQASFIELQAEGIDLTYESVPFVSLFTSRRAAAKQYSELLGMVDAGFDSTVNLLSADTLQRLEPLTEETSYFGVEIADQGIVNPPRMLSNLRGYLRSEGCEFVAGTVNRVALGQRGKIQVCLKNGAVAHFDKAVVASGARLGNLVSAHGVRPDILAGFGFSLRVEVPRLPRGILYFPELKIASTRLDNSLRMSTLLQLGSPGKIDSWRVSKRLRENAMRAVPTGNWESVADEWVGMRPITSDSLPVIGETRTRNIFVNGGHGMWGVTMAPISARLLVEAIIKEYRDIRLDGFSASR